MKSFIVYHYDATNKLKAIPMLLIWRWICFYPARPENTEENQPIINLKPSPTPQSPIKELKFSPEDCFSAQIYMM